MGEFILEQLGNRSQMESKRLDDFKRSPLDTVWFDSMTKGEIWNSIKFYGESVTSDKPKGFMLRNQTVQYRKTSRSCMFNNKEKHSNPGKFLYCIPF